MKLTLWAVVMAALALLLAGTALATTNDPRLDAVATRIAQQDVTVICYEGGEPDEPEAYGAWGYVYLWAPVEHMAPEVCEGARAIADSSAAQRGSDWINPAVPLWKQALGALVLAHESYHLRENLGDRGNEASTECRAIRHFKYTVQFLGGSAQLADALLPYALAIHWRIAAKAPQYNKKSCKVPNWWGS